MLIKQTIALDQNKPFVTKFMNIVDVYFYFYDDEVKHYQIIINISILK